MKKTLLYSGKEGSLPKLILNAMKRNFNAEEKMVSKHQKSFSPQEHNPNFGPPDSRIHILNKSSFTVSSCKSQNMEVVKTEKTETDLFKK